MNQIQSPDGVLPTLVDNSSRPSVQIAAENRQLIQAVKSLSKSDMLMLGSDNELTYSVDRETRRAVVKVIHKETKQVLYQVPPETVLELAREAQKRTGDD